MDADEIGWRFWVGLVAVTLGVGVGMLVCFLLFGAIWASWGLLGAFLFFGAVLLGLAWVHDRRAQRRRATSDPSAPSSRADSAGPA